LITDWLLAQHPLLQALIRILVVLLPILMLVPGLIWWERRLLSWMQDRIGPNRTGPFGLLQTLADGIKLFTKEDITPSAVDRVIYFIAPAVALFPAFALAATLPWGPTFTGPIWGAWTPIADVNIGLLYILAISSLGVYGVVLAGYASNNKYSLMGGLRASAQLISYELAMGMSLAVIVLATGSLRLTEMVQMQMAPLWGASVINLGVIQFMNPFQNWFIFTPYGFIAAIIFAICIVAETNRAPFDLPEAENELIAGYHTEYSSMKFAVFFMGEYAAMFVFSGVFAVVFLGGFNFVPINWNELAAAYPAAAPVFNFLWNMNILLAPLWFLAKCAFGISVFVWLRATLPRLRYDQLMSLGWKSLLPLAVANFIIMTIWILTANPVIRATYGTWIVAIPIALAILTIIGWLYTVRATTRGQAERRGVRLVDGGSSTEKAVS
jgi:NADH-quinone oxidoreductase subunit H